MKIEKLDLEDLCDALEASKSTPTHQRLEDLSIYVFEIAGRGKCVAVQGAVGDAVLITQS